MYTRLYSGGKELSRYGIGRRPLRDIRQGSGVSSCMIRTWPQKQGEGRRREEEEENVPLAMAI